MSTDFSPERLESLVLSGQVNIVRAHLGATAAERIRVLKATGVCLHFGADLLGSSYNHDHPKELKVCNCTGSRIERVTIGRKKATTNKPKKVFLGQQGKV